MTLTVYIHFAGRCGEAFDFYATQLGAVPGVMIRHGQGPNANWLPPEWDRPSCTAASSSAASKCWPPDIPSAEPMHSAYLTLRHDSSA